MQSITTDSIDIDSLRGRMLGDTQPFDQGLRSAHDAFQHALSQPIRRRPSSQLSLMPENDSGLPSTVPESLEAQRSQFNADGPRKMSQVEDATQEVSQEYYDQRIEQSKSGLAIAKHTDTQRSRVEGDAGYVDLTSSFVPNEENDEPVDEDSEPVEFLPTQDRTQSQRDHFTDTQRFKTPATAGKKRYHDGNTKDTPTLPRRPQLGGGTPGMAMGLSQAFADTQAQTSPFVGQILPESARPSPNIELEQRPATAPLSSPLKKISEVRNSSAEPAIRYVSVEESQRRRDAERERELLAEEVTDSDDDFGRPSTEARNWAAQMRNRGTLGPTKSRVEAATPSPKRRKGASSPTNESSPRFSARPPTRMQRRQTPPSPLIEDDGPDSEAETEEDEEEALVLHSSQRRHDPEDKENIDSAVHVPRTVAHPSITAAPLSEVQMSPSLRNYQPPGSAGPLVPNTQISQRASQRVQLKSSTTSGVDFVPQSQDVAEEQKEPSGQGLGGTSGPDHTTADGGGELQQSVERDIPYQGRGDQDSVNEDVEMQDVSQDEVDEDEEGPEEAVQSSPPAPTRAYESHQDTVPETVSSRGVAKQASTGSGGRSLLATTDFDTAPSHMPPPAVKANLHSSPPPKSPPRMHRSASDILSMTTPNKGDKESWSQIFEPSVALQDDDNIGGIRDHSPIAPRSRRKKAGWSILEVAETASTEKVQIPLSDSEQDLDTTDELFASQPAVQPKKQNTAPSRGRDIYDMETTPSPQKAALMSKSSRSLRSRVGKNGTKTPPPKAVEATKPEDDESESSTDRQPKQTQTPKRTPKKLQQPRRLPSVESASTPSTPTETFKTAPTGEVVAPNAVFACFNGKTRAYYPAWCIGKGCTEGHCMIQWEGYDPDEIDVYGVRSLDLRVGDQVKIDLKGVPKVSHVIHDFKDKLEGDALSKTITDQRGFKTVVVAPKQRKSLPSGISTENEREVPISAIYLDSNMWAQMKDRTYTFRSPPESVKASGYISPDTGTPSGSQSRARRQTGIPAPTISASGLLQGMVFAVSYEDSSRRGKVENMIWSNGGHIVADDGFADLFEHDSLTLKAKCADANFTALLADKHSRKPKYLQALALGLPCLSGSWIDACIEKSELLDWRQYLLPAGECDKLEGAAKSRVMPYVPADEAKLAAQLQTRERILDGEKVAVIVGRAKAEAKMKNYLFFVRAMGVELLEKVPDVRAAKELVDGDDGYGLVLVERDVEAVEAALQAGRSGREGGGKSRAKATERVSFVVSDTERIVQSLIFGSRVV